MVRNEGLYALFVVSSHQLQLAARGISNCFDDGEHLQDDAAPGGDHGNVRCSAWGLCKANCYMGVFQVYLCKSILYFDLQ